MLQIWDVGGGLVQVSEHVRNFPGSLPGSGTLGWAGVSANIPTFGDEAAWITAGPRR